jgi:hypothetical protein
VGCGNVFFDFLGDSWWNAVRRFFLPTNQRIATENVLLKSQSNLKIQKELDYKTIV